MTKTVIFDIDGTLYDFERANEICIEALSLLDIAVPFPGAEKTMQELKKQGIRIGIGSDMTSRLQFLKLERLGLLGYVDFVVTSEEAGVDKPGRKLFELCVKKAAAAPEECLFIGDNFKKDYCGATDAGMKALWFVPPEKYVPSNLAWKAMAEQIRFLPEILDRILQEA